VPVKVLLVNDFDSAMFSQLARFGVQRTPAWRSNLKRGLDADALPLSCRHAQSFCATVRCGFI
jgi:hypothetical protein